MMAETDLRCTAISSHNFLSKSRTESLMESKQVIRLSRSREEGRRLMRSSLPILSTVHSGS